MAGLARRGWIAGLLLLLLAGLWWGAKSLVPGWVRGAAGDWTQEELGLDLALGEIHFDPLRLSLDLQDIALPAGKPMVAARRVHLDLSARSLFTGTWRLDSVRIDSPRIEAELDAEGRLNLARLVPPDDGEPMPSILVADLAVADGQAGFRDLAHGPEAQARLLPFEFTLQDLHTTRDEGGRFQLKGTTAAGEALAWAGTLSLAPLASQGGLAIRNLDGARVGAFLGDELPSQIRGGRADLTIPYRAVLRDGTMELVLVRPRIEARDLDLLVRPDTLNAAVRAGSARIEAGEARFTRNSAGASSWALAVPVAHASDFVLEGTGPASGEVVRAASLRFAGVAAGGGAGAITAETLAIAGLEVSLDRAPGGSIRLLRILPKASGDTPAEAPPIAIARIDLADARLTFDERSTPRRGRYTLQPLTAVVTGFRSDGATPLRLEASGSLNGRPLKVAGTTAGDFSRADVTIRLNGLPMAAALPYLPDFPALELISGTLSVDGRVRYAAAARGNPQLDFGGTVDLDGFRLRELVRNSDLFRFQTLRLSGLSWDGRALVIDEGRLIRPVGQVALLADGQFNYGFLLDEGTSLADAQARLSGRKTATKKLTRAERRAARAKADAEKAARAQARTLPGPRAAEPELPFTVRDLRIESGSLVFSDFVIEPAFQARIEAVRGHVRDLTNQPGKVARIALDGQVVDRFAPVRIEGRMNLFDYAENTDMKLEFRNIDLPVFNPYSGTYAGYAIAKGKLTATLDYRVQDSALKAQHKVVIDQLEWGEATESQQKVGLPVRFATSILKDRNGVITLELPVAGTVDDPEFSLMPLVWKALGQFMGKLVTAPFRALGGLFADKEDAQFVDFAPGSAAPPPGSEAVFQELGRALAERPALRLDIPAAPGLAADADAMAAAALDAAAMTGARKAEAGTAFADLPLDRQYDLLRDLYGKRLKGKPDFADEEGQDKAERRAARVKEMQTALLPLFRPDGAALRQLGEARAGAVRTAVLEVPDIDPARVFLDGNDRFALADGQVRMELKLR